MKPHKGQSKAKSQMLLGCSTSWWYSLTLSGSLQSHKPLSLVPPCNTGKQCLTGIATPNANRDLHDLSDLDLCYPDLIARQSPCSKPCMAEFGDPDTGRALQHAIHLLYLKYKLHKIKHSRLTNSLFAIEITNDVHPLQK